MTASTYSGCGYTVFPSWRPSSTASCSASVFRRHPFPVDPRQSLAVGVHNFTATHCENVSPKPLPFPCDSLHRWRLASIRGTSAHPKTLAVGVGILAKQEQPIPLVVRANATGSESEGQHHVSQTFELRSESPPRPRRIWADACRILSENKPWATRRNHADEFSAKRRRPRAARDAGSAILLAGIAPAEEIDALEFGSHDSDILVTPHRRPVLGQHGTAKRIDFHLKFDLEASPLQPQIEAANTREQTAHCQFSGLSCPLDRSQAVGFIIGV